MRVEREEWVKYKLLLPARGGYSLRELTVDGGPRGVTFEEAKAMQDALNALPAENGEASR